MTEIKIETKVCTRCNEEKELMNFYRQEKIKPDGSKWIYHNPQCKDCVKLKSLERHHEHKEEYNKRSKQWYAKNKEQVLAEKKIYILDKKDQYSDVQKEWRLNNKNKTKEYNEKYKRKQFKLKTKQWNACKEYFNFCCAYCGITEKEAKEIQGKNLNKEHAYNLGNNDLSNCLPSCTSCNSSKHKNDFVDWYTPENPVYNDDRLKLIEQWLEVDYKKFI
jgi:hypothetical protein